MTSPLSPPLPPHKPLFLTLTLHNADTFKSESIVIPSAELWTERGFNWYAVISRIGNVEERVVQVYSPGLNQYLPELRFGINKQLQMCQILDQDVSQVLQKDFLIVKHTARTRCDPQAPQDPHLSGDNSSHSSDIEDHKEKRSGQRTIGDVIELVQRWREYHAQKSVLGKKRTLNEAARHIGVSKKSLDDYYYQLRVGERYEFNFAEHLGDKIGVLRNFIKSKEPERKVNGKNSKHGKELKIIEQFAQKLRITERNEANQNNRDDKDHSLRQNSKKRHQAHPEQWQQEPAEHAQPENYDIQSRMSQIQKGQNQNQKFSDNFSVHLLSEISVDDGLMFWGSPSINMNQEEIMHWENNFFQEFEWRAQDFANPNLSLERRISQ